MLVGVVLRVLRVLRSRRARITGTSMLPALRPGDVVLATPAPVSRGLVGSVVLVRDLVTGRLDVKRVVAGPGDVVVGHALGCWVNGAWWGLGLGDLAPTPGRQWRCGPDEYFLLGDNAGASTDSRAAGPVNAAAIQAEVWLVAWPPGAVRRVVGRGPAAPPAGVG